MFIFYVLCGLVSGVIAGMGMGGGTILIPLLTLLLGVCQKLAQATNLIVFIPLSIVVLVIYFKKGLIKLKGIWFLMIPSLIVSAIGSIFSIKIENQILKTIFGIGLILAGISLLISLIIRIVRNKKCEKLK